MFAAVSRLPYRAWPWVMLTCIAAGLLLCALYFQFIVGLKPCMMCVYQRVAVVGIMLAGLIGIWGHPYALMRWLSYSVWIVSSGWGLKVAHDQVLEEQLIANGGFSSCAIFPDFPQWAPLHEWLPDLFKPTGICGEVLWTLFGYSMPFWMRVVFGCLLAAGLVVVASQLKQHKYNPYD